MDKHRNIFEEQHAQSPRSCEADTGLQPGVINLKRLGLVFEKHGQGQLACVQLDTTASRMPSAPSEVSSRQASGRNRSEAVFDWTGLRSNFKHG